MALHKTDYWIEFKKRIKERAKAERKVTALVFFEREIENKKRLNSDHKQR